MFENALLAYVNIKDYISDNKFDFYLNTNKN